MKNIIKRIIVGVSIFLIIGFFKSCEVNAISTDNYVTLNNTTMSSSIKKYIDGAVNVNVSIRPKTTSSINYDAPQYGYLALCSAFGSYSNRYINTVSSNVVEELSVINSTVGCTIPTTSDYRTTSRVVYITFKIPFNKYDCGAGGVCQWNTNLNFAWYQPTSNEFSLISFGFKNDPYNFNETTDPKVIQNDTIIQQNDTTINQNNTIIQQNDTTINQNNQIIDQNRQINTNIVEGNQNTQNKIQEQTDVIKDSSIPTNVNGDINDLNNNIGSNGTITSLVTMPITFLQKIILGLNGSCSPIIIGELYNYNMTMPCINPSQYIGIIWNIIDVICAGFLSFHFSKKLVSIFHKITSMKDGGLEEAYD